MSFFLNLKTEWFDALNINICVSVNQLETVQRPSIFFHKDSDPPKLYYDFDEDTYLAKGCGTQISDEVDDDDNHDNLGLDDDHDAAMKMLVLVIKKRMEVAWMRKHWRRTLVRCMQG